MTNFVNKCVMASLLTFTSLLSFNAVASGNIDSGKALMKKYNCAACHGEDYNSPLDSSYPKLAGQHADYLKHALLTYKRGGAAVNGRSNAIMGAQVKPLSDKDIADISAYLGSLKGSLVVRK
ncbi:cytochrome c [Herbaspirillum sp. RTI4]|uniref:c-type cytochrome n=1 Tax=Herbaspirillum sp. RTI4 TaxID=3048640 RepID=UPI002AB58EA1|nr:cytochrome c [Herbaspirillum sp. RTI4]MDY7579722.1 cytochrome c [Herbaspirillum sp. RTI4]MEA9983049.1 cytochrome c [Herbaspirillum sp. RTI4]